ncbi:chitin deacetylase [Entomortierella beljakovae]|nr:chitin deacetylase [Entomortierella beljakovae]
MTLVMSALLFPTTLAEMSKAQQKKFPPKDELPDVNSALVKKWVSEVDWSKVPKLPVAEADIPNSPDCPNNKKLIPKDACWWTCDGCVAKDDVETCPRQNAWGLTYDDGPSEETPRLLKKLKEANVTSTFFVVGSRVLEYPEIVLQQVKDGHHIGLHSKFFFFEYSLIITRNELFSPFHPNTYFDILLNLQTAWSHAGMTSLTNEQIVAELKWAEKAVFDVTGLKAKYWRPPYGDVDNRVREIARQLGYVTVIWTKEWDSNDWQIPDKAITNKQVYRNFKWALSTVPKMKGGIITLEHDLYTQTVNVAGPLLDMGIKGGLEPMDIAQCVNDPHPYQNSLIEDKKPVTVNKEPVAKPDDKKAPVAKPDEVQPKQVDSEGEKPPTKSASGDKDTEIKKMAKPSSANQLAWAASSIAIVATTILFSL